jgi:FAD/FMN-containing dehydrogenase
MSLDFKELRSQIEGDVVVSGSNEAKHLVKVANARFDWIEPAATILCRSSDDVSRAITFIGRHRLESAIRCGGHCLAGRSSTGGVLIDVSPMRSVSAANERVVVGAGALLGEVYIALLQLDRAIPGGTCPSVGISGLTLGGGLGMLGRTLGLTSDNLLSCKVAVADGRVLDCDANHNADLFWGLRGGGAGSFGVVTELTFKSVPAPAVVTSFGFTWPLARAAHAIAAWLEWIGSSPDEIAASLDLRLSENAEEPPVVELYGTMLGNVSDVHRTLGPVVARIEASPISSSVAEGSYVDALHYWASRAGEQLENPRAARDIRHAEFVKSGFFVHRIPPEAIARLVEIFVEKRVAGESRNVDFSPWGGAYARIASDSTAFVHRDAAYWIKHSGVVGVTSPTEMREALRAWAFRSWESCRMWGTGGVFPNFPDPDLEDWGHAYYGSNYQRLVEIKSRYDPGNLFRFAQSVPPR